MLNHGHAQVATYQELVLCDEISGAKPLHLLWHASSALVKNPMTVLAMRRQPQALHARVLWREGKSVHQISSQPRVIKIISEISTISPKVSGRHIERWPHAVALLAVVPLSEHRTRIILCFIVLHKRAFITQTCKSESLPNIRCQKPVVAAE